MKNVVTVPDSSDIEEIKKLLMQIGCSVEDVSSIGTGLPLLLVGANGMNVLLQHGGTVEMDWHGPIYVVKTKLEALERVNRIRNALMAAGISSH